jgi:antirestriction protein ArdC
MDVYGMITDRIIEKLEAGTVPWHNPWRSVGPARNLVSKKPYSGINVWLLTAQGYTAPFWATIRQINKLGGQVRKGEQSTPVIFWRIYVDGVEVKINGDQDEPEHEQEEQRGRRRFVLRYYSVFNSEQCELPPTLAEELAVLKEGTIDPIEACEKVLAGLPNVRQLTKPFALDDGAWQIEGERLVKIAAAPPGLPHRRRETFMTQSSLTVRTSDRLIGDVP